MESGGPAVKRPGGWQAAGWQALSGAGESEPGGARLARRPVVGVMGSGTRAERARAGEVGRWLARAGFHLLTGGGGGAMGAVSEAFFEIQPREGRVIGVIPGPEAPASYPNRWVEIALFTHLPLTGERGMEPMSRNHVNVLSSDALIALPGGAGTASEVRLALAYGRPLVAYLDDPREIEGLPDGVRVESDFAEVQRFVLAALL